jgi:ABC-type phosphate transport system permease subunit
MSIVFFFAAFGLVAFVIVGYFVILNAWNNIKEVEPKELPDVYDLPNWEKLNPIAKNANRELNKMYKGKMRGELV